MVLKIVFHMALSHLPGGLGHFADSNSILWELLCAGFRHSASLHARVILDGATCRLSELGDVLDVLSVLAVW